MFGQYTDVIAIAVMTGLILLIVGAIRLGHKILSDQMDIYFEHKKERLWREMTEEEREMVRTEMKKHPRNRLASQELDELYRRYFG